MLDKRFYRYLFSFVFLSSLIFKAGCGTTRKEAIAFNKKLVNQQQRINQLSREFGETIRKAVTTGRHDGTCRKSLEILRNEVVALESQNWNLVIPDGDNAREFFELHQQMLRGVLKSIDKDFIKLVAIAEDSQSSAEEKNRKLKEVFQTIDSQEELIKKIIAVQKKFAIEYSFELHPK